MSLAQIEPVMEQGWNVIRELSADEEARLQAEEREKYRRDIDAYYQTGILDQSRVIAQRMLQGGMPLEQITSYTGLTVDQVRELKQQ